MNQFKLIGPFTQLVSMANSPIKGAISFDNIEVIENAGILIEGEKIYAVGEYKDLIQKYESLQIDLIELKTDYVCLPGFIDAHTHICFAGSRANDYALRNAGKSYLEIAKTGGGIWDTVTQTRKADLQNLLYGVIKRSNCLLKRGITTAEVKSGYGLSVEEELKMLRAIRDANTSVEIDLIPTCLAAHILPKDFKGDHAAYLEEISTTLFPILKSEMLTNRIDAFIEEEAFSPIIIASYLEKAKKMGFDITIHADQFSAGGSQVAIDHQAISADHLEASTQKEIDLLANSNVIAVALPGASIGLGCDFTPARKILDAGGALAIASDWNPGSAPMGDLLMQACILGTFQKLSNAELLAGVTFRAAAALGLKDRGRLAKEQLADFNMFPTNHFNEIFYHQGKLTPSQVWKRGDLIFSDPSTKIHCA